MSVLNPPSSDDEQPECPLCMEFFELDDISFYPCSCGYQVRIFEPPIIMQMFNEFRPHTYCLIENGIYYTCGILFTISDLNHIMFLLWDICEALFFALRFLSKLACSRMFRSVSSWKVGVIWFLPKTDGAPVEWKTKEMRPIFLQIKLGTYFKR